MPDSQPIPKPADFDIKVGDVLTWGQFGKHQLRVTQVSVERRERTRMRPRRWTLRLDMEEIA